MSALQRQLPIIGGASKHDLLAQLSNIGRLPTRPGFLVTVLHPIIKEGLIPKADIKILINGVTAEDGSGEGWFIAGYIPLSDPTMQSCAWLQQEFRGHGNDLCGFYSVRTRRGFICAGTRAF